MTTTTSTSTMAVPRVSRQRTAAAADATAARDNRFRILQLALFAAGAVLMPLGIVAICLGWYGSAHSHYTYDQNTYLVSGGILGLGLTFLGGFLYFGAWLAKVGSDQRESSRQLADAMLLVAELMSRQAPAADGVPAEDGAELVLAGGGTTVHRRDCQLIAHRDDLRPLTGAEGELATCRVCRPTVDALL